ncbi:MULTISPECIES: peptidoglycan DD-metalloendopeptidase family protein [Streptomyces]|uniref:M23 family metallopeptidase n=2 Tax=Streptomyces TaxID=1883 RepID=A0A3M8F9A8_9ACTN|nr:MULTISPECIES: M23 family metallopeptidase [Streptomyces]KNE82909.1 peptidase M23 [Streptomyces fradiae]OFA48760.1 peptidase M23 [Streptomyces fradiae]PQM23396.1 M23 family peptidase [Streptomyces xinghaiensis]RKM94961.1 M23 family metallopeptidase [Streptomyces xinghaiensis]RNC74600.1 M23 family metallopeptidase [Streptomyces xinghaiensis]
MSGNKGALAGLAVGAGAMVFAPVLLFLAVSGGGTEAGATGGGALKTGTVPPEYVPWVLRAGAMCPEIGPAVIAAQIEAESNWNPDAESPVGAQGLSQFMPGTWTSWGRDDDGNGRVSPFDPGDAIMAQGRYDCSLAKQVKRYKDRGIAAGPTLDLTLAAYNAGPGAVEQYGGIPPYTETQGYVTRIKSLIAKYEDVAAGGGGGGGGGGTIPAGRKMAMPLAGNPPMTSPYGMRVHPVTGVNKLHTGIDFGVPSGTPIRAAMDGTVTFAGWNTGYGNRVVISHGTMDGKTIATTYNHMSAIGVSKGQKVKVGAPVGAVGSTGYSTGAHLHFEVQQNGQYVNPAPWIGK